jgi:hypothetical protein
MGTHIEGSFEVSGWDEHTCAEFDQGARLARAHITQAFSGPLSAEGSWDALLCYREDGSADFVGLEHVQGRIGEREGGFILQTVGTYDGNETIMSWGVVPGTATGQLAGLRGRGRASARHGAPGNFSFDYGLN